MQTVETLVVTGAQRDMVQNHNLAWQALANVLGSDTIAKWVLKSIIHGYIGSGPNDEPAAEFRAEFVRVEETADVA
jgi:hypothetical protein